MTAEGVIAVVAGILAGSIALIGFGIDSAIEGIASVILCAYLSLAVLAGLALNAVFGCWWADPLAALVIAGVAVREGLEAWRGKECC